MNRQILTPIDDLALDGACHEILMLEDRVRELEADNRALRELLHLSLDRLRDRAQRERDMTRRLRELTSTAQRLRQAA
jgi:hypothetical protein